MRLWHKDLIKVLPRQQLLAQWRECVLINKNIIENNTPNHILVNKIIDYPYGHFLTYCKLVIEEMLKRGYKVSDNSLNKVFNNYHNVDTDREIFPQWHNDRYYRQCCYNLQEKYDCGGITEDEWKLIIQR